MTASSIEAAPTSGAPKNTGSQASVRRHRALEAELDDVEERLGERRPDAALQAGGEAAVGAFQRQPEHEREEPAGEEQRRDQNGSVTVIWPPQAFSPSAARSGANRARRKIASGVS